MFGTTAIDRHRVRSGVRWMNENRPGWASRIDTGTLNIQDPFLCVLGQTGGYGVVRREMGSCWVIEHGFCGTGGSIRGAWLRAIRKQRRLDAKVEAKQFASAA